MKEFDIVPTLKIKRKGVFDLEGLYLMVRGWLDINGLFNNLKETEYTERTMPFGKELEVNWDTYYDVSSYVKFKIKISFMAVGLSKVEIQKGHKKIPRDKGSIEVKLEGKVIYDPDDKYKKNIFTFRFILPYEIKMKKRLDAYKLELYKRIYALHKEIKLYLDMHEF